MSARKPFRYAAQIRRELQAVGVAEQERAKRFVEGRLSLLPWHWGRHVAAQHAARGGGECAEANRWLLAVTDAGAAGLVRLAAGDEDVRTSALVAVREARDRAMLCRGVGVLAAVARVCVRWGVDPAPVARGSSDPWPAIRRMLCERWWLRRLRAMVARRCEAAAIKAGLVRRGLWPYASQDTVERRRAQLARGRAAVESAVLEDADSGEQCDLSAVVDGSVSHPVIRRGELMTRVRGCDEYAKGRGWACEFWTLTCPSRFHAQTVVDGVARENPRYGGESPRAAQAYLCKVWARARAAWKRRGLDVVGLRTAEPHHDGTPHWHLVAYGSRRDLRFARRLLRVYALRDSPGEPGARARRFVSLLAQDGTAARYVAKYVAKNIDGYSMAGELDDESGRSVPESVARVDAWAAAWRVRQFQFFGGAAVGVWRVLRRMRESVAESGEVIERARVAADRGDWCGYLKACEGGAVRVLREAGERLTQYGDAAAARVVGVVDGGRRALLNLRSWVVRWGARVVEGARRSVGGPLVLCQ